MTDLKARIQAYQRAMAVAREMLAKGIISEEEYGKINTMIAKKYGVNSSELL